MADAITWSNDVGRWPANIPEGMQEYWLKMKQVLLDITMKIISKALSYDVPQHRKDRNSS